MKKNLVLIAILASFALGGCSSLSGPGIFNGLDEKNPMSSLAVYTTGHKPPTLEQYQTIVGIIRELEVQLAPQLSSPTEAAISSALPFGAAGALGGAIEGPIAAAAAGTGTAIAGFINGAWVYSYAKVWINAYPVEMTLRDREADGDKSVHGLHVEACFVRCYNTMTSPAPGLLELMQPSPKP